jgi:DNA (cytosine-5)-methyltransferase 1
MFQGLIIDGFAGGGGASTGIEQALGRDVDLAINHSPSAIAIHKANHPGTEHLCQDIRAVWPKAATRLQPVAVAWFSPDCKEYSKAKGGPVKNRHIRALSNEVTYWLREVQPLVAFIENVEEYEYAAPLDENGVPIPELKGRDFKRLVRAWRGLGYKVDWRTLRACDYGTPTSRRRLYIILRRDGRPIVWPKPTHRPAGFKHGIVTAWAKGHGLTLKDLQNLPTYPTAAECIDWSIECPSIFTRKRPLKDATLRRIAHGVMRYVVNAAQPFLVPVTHSGDARVYGVDEPKRTITTANGGEFAAVDVELAPHITKFHSGSVGSPMDKEMPVVTSNGDPERPAGAMPLGLVGATLVRTGHGEVDRSGKRRGKGHHDIAEPAPTPTASRDEALAAVHLHKMAQNGVGKDPAEPLDTAMSGATRHGLVAATMVRTDMHQSNAINAFDAHDPLRTIDTGGGHAAVTAFLSSFYGSNTTGGGGDPAQPNKVVRAGGQHHAVVAAHIEQANTGMVGHTPRKPLSTIVGKGSTQRIVETTMIEEGALPADMMERAVQVAAFLVKYYGSEVGQHQRVDKPIDVITVQARYAVVTVTIDAVTYVIVDIGLRMLKPRELARAQGFPDDYVLDPIVRKIKRGKEVFEPLTIAEQISAIGNSVCPPVARALVAANQPGLGQ